MLRGFVHSSCGVGKAFGLSNLLILLGSVRVSSGVRRRFGVDLEDDLGEQRVFSGVKVPRLLDGVIVMLSFV